MSSHRHASPSTAAAGVEPQGGGILKEAKFDVELDKARLFDSSFAANINDDTGIDAGLLLNMRDMIPSPHSFTCPSYQNSVEMMIQYIQNTHESCLSKLSRSANSILKDIDKRLLLLGRGIGLPERLIICSRAFSVR